MNPFIQNPETLIKLGNRIGRLLERVETPVGLIIILTIIAEQYTDLSLTVLRVIAMLSLATLYFFSSYAQESDKEVNGLSRFIIKLSGYGSSIATIGVLFTFEKWPGYNTALTSGCLVLLFCLVFIAYQRLSDRDGVIESNRAIVRIIILTVLCAGLYFFPAAI